MDKRRAVSPLGEDAHPESLRAPCDGAPDIPMGYNPNRLPADFKLVVHVPAPLGLRLHHARDVFGKIEHAKDDEFAQ